MGSTLQTALPIDISIPRGTYHNENVIASGVMDQDSSQPPGDAHFRIKVRPHTRFTNKGYDLALRIEITLAEAITGVSRTIRHLDGRTVRIVSAAVAAATATGNSGTDMCGGGPVVIATGDVHVVKGEGMPKDARGTEFGDLYVQYQVNMPQNKGSVKSKDHKPTLTEAERNELDRLLNKLEGKTINTSKKVHWPFQSYVDRKIMTRASVSDFGKNAPKANDHDASSSFSSSSTPFEPFGPGSGFTPMGRNRGFFWSSSTSSGGTSHPFGQSVPSEDDGTQCRQM
jgi:DnaJ-class molecular chaperone